MEQSSAAVPGVSGSNAGLGMDMCQHFFNVNCSLRINFTSSGESMSTFGDANHRVSISQSDESKINWNSCYKICNIQQEKKLSWTEHKILISEEGRKIYVNEHLSPFYKLP